MQDSKSFTGHNPSSSRAVHDPPSRDHTLRDCVELYVEDELGRLSQREQTNVVLAIDLVDALWGLDIPAAAVDQGKVAAFIRARTEKVVSFSGTYGRRALEPVQHGTAIKNLRTFARITAYAADRRQPTGEPLLAEDSFRRISWPMAPGRDKEHREPIPCSVHRALLVPWRHPRTGEELAAPVDRVDPTGLLRMLLHVLFFTGHRLGAVLGLQVGDLLFEEEAVRRHLGRLGGAHRVWWARLFARHGAIRWRAEKEKDSRGRVIPISPALRRLLETYVETLPSPAPDAPLFPSPRDSRRPIGASTLFRVRCVRPAAPGGGWKIRSGGWFTEALFQLRAQLALEGIDPGELVPVDVDEATRTVRLPWKAHSYRRRFARTLRRLGYVATDRLDGACDLDRHMRFLGGWSILGRGVMLERYAELDPAVLVAAVSFRPAHEVLRERAGAEADRLADVLAAIEAVGRARGPGVRGELRG